jgi:hypothetical protein
MAALMRAKGPVDNMVAAGVAITEQALRAS